MAANKINKDKVLQLIKEEAYIITRKKEIYEVVKQLEDELKNLNECMGLAGQGIVGTMGFQGPNDVTKKIHASGFVNPMSISHLAQLAQDMGMENPYEATSKESEGFGDEYNSKSNGADEAVKNENELLKKEIEQLKSMLGNKQ
jgi:hypothetical protein